MQIKKIICYIAGCIILFLVACLVIPKIINIITNKVYKKSVKEKNASYEDDDWGPKLVKKTEEE